MKIYTAENDLRQSLGGTRVHFCKRCDKHTEDLYNAVVARTLTVFCGVPSVQLVSPVKAVCNTELRDTFRL